MEQGKVRLATGKNFGFVKAADGTDVFVPPSCYPGNLSAQDGDEISFEIGAGPKGPRAEKVTLVNRGTSAALTVKPTTPTPAPAQLQSIEVEWNGSLAHNVLLLTLTLTGAKGRSGIEVKLKANGTYARKPSPNPSPDGKGNVVFFVPIKAQTKLYAFAADIIVDGKVEKTSTYSWEKRPSRKVVHVAAATPATDAEKKLPEIEVVNPPRDPDPSTSLFRVNVLTRKDGKKANRDFIAICDHPIEIRQFGQPNAVKTFTATAQGQYELDISFKAVMVNIIFKLDNGKEANVWLRK